MLSLLAGFKGAKLGKYTACGKVRKNKVHLV